MCDSTPQTGTCNIYQEKCISIYHLVCFYNIGINTRKKKKRQASNHSKVCFTIKEMNDIFSDHVHEDDDDDDDEHIYKAIQLIYSS